VAAAVYYPDGEICEMNRPSRNPFADPRAFLRTALRGRRGFHLKAVDYSGPIIPVDVTSFVGFFISAGAVERVGYPDGRLFVYGEDGLYTLALSQSGGRILFAPDLRFDHDCRSIQDGRFRPLWKVYYYHRNLLMLYRRAAGPWFWPAMAVIGPRWLFKTRAHGGERRAFLALLGRAWRDGLAERAPVDHAEILALSRRGDRLSD
jgi:GT2 family glycosyltransferase